jgi:hypothetical protein
MSDAADQLRAILDEIPVMSPTLSQQGLPHFHLFQRKNTTHAYNNVVHGKSPCRCLQCWEASAYAPVQISNEDS